MNNAEQRRIDTLFTERQDALETDPRRELKGDGLSFGATPLNNNAGQYAIFLELEERIKKNAPKGLSKPIRRFFRQHFASRFYLRQDRNMQSLADRKFDDLDDIGSETVEALQLGLEGTAAPYQLIDVMRSLGMPSIELARLTHPYGKGIEPSDDGRPSDLDLMRDAVNYAIELHGGTVIDNDAVFRDGSVNTSFEVDHSHVLSFDRTHLGEGFLMKRKRMIGILPDGTEVIERSSFVMNVEKIAKIDPEVAGLLGSIVVKDNPKWMEEIMAIEGFTELVAMLLDNNKFKVAIPLSTTIYAHNEAREVEVKAEKVALRKAMDDSAAERKDRHEALTGSNDVVKTDSSDARPVDRFVGIAFAVGKNPDRDSVLSMKEQKTRAQKMADLISRLRTRLKLPPGL